MTSAGWLPAPATDLFGPDATAEESYGVLTVDVPRASWTTALRTARDDLACTYFDWLSAVDEPGTGFRVSAHVVALAPVRRLLLRTTVPHEAPALDSAVDVYAGAAWHERETHEMFGVRFTGHPALHHLLLPENFEGHPLRKDFVLAARVAKAWPGAKEPGESEHGGPKRRQMLPPGVPDPNEWGPLKGQLPPAPARPTRPTRATAAGRPAGDRPPRRTRTTTDGSASPHTPAPEHTPVEGTPMPESPASAAPPPAPVRPPAGPRRTRTASQGSASQRPQPSAPDPSSPSDSAAPSGPASASDSDRPTRPAPAPRSSDAPWHHARPAFDEPEPRRRESTGLEADSETEGPESTGPGATGPESPDEPESAQPSQGEEPPSTDAPEPQPPSPGNPTPGNPARHAPTPQAPTPEAPPPPSDTTPNPADPDTPPGGPR